VAILLVKGEMGSDETQGVSIFLFFSSGVVVVYNVSNDLKSIQAMVKMIVLRTKPFCIADQMFGGL